jgi:PAS domain S-box-containing protein
MSLPVDPKGWFLNDLAAIEERIARHARADLQRGEPSDHFEKRYRHLVENSLGLICTHALDGTVLSVNPAAADSLGYEPRDGIGRNLRDFLAPGTRQLFDDYLRRIRERSRDSGLMRVVRRDGSERLWLYRNVLYSQPGAQPYVLGHAIDVTERVAAEAALRRHQTETLEATTRLAGRVAHAFNNLLTVILGSSELLIAEVGSNPRARAHLDAVVRAASRGAAVTRHLLAVGGQQVIDHNVLDLNAIVSGVERSLHRLCGARISVVLALAPGQLLVEGDAAQVEQVLLHLASNARDAMPDGGTLTVTTQLVPVEAAPSAAGDDSPNNVVVTVRDTGRGMDANTRAHLFEPFFTSKSAGFVEGLGLPTVYGVVRQLGGEISVESALGRGTTFTIALPQATATTVASAPPAIADTYRPPTETILLVDDEADVRSVVRQVLHQRGYTVLSAASGAQAMQIIENHTGPLNLLVTDVLMPGMSGPQLFEQLVTRYPGLKVLYISGYADEELGRNPGAGAAFLAKPFRLETLATKVRHVLDSE